VALDLAGSAGIDVPDSQLVEIAGRNVLIVTRFDRDDNRRIGYCSALTMLEARDGQQRSYLDIASKIEEISPSATDELHQLWRRVAFSILIFEHR
jgi:serine/threonine-protein kinase HipA